MRKGPARDAPGRFPPALTVEVKALACELPAALGVPLSRLSVADVRRQAEQRGPLGRISDSTIWRWLHKDAIRPGQHRCWIFPRDPEFPAKAHAVTAGLVVTEMADGDPINASLDRNPGPQIPQAVTPRLVRVTTSARQVVTNFHRPPGRCR